MSTFSNPFGLPPFGHSPDKQVIYYAHLTQGVDFPNEGYSAQADSYNYYDMTVSAENGAFFKTPPATGQIIGKPFFIHITTESLYGLILIHEGGSVESPIENIWPGELWMLICTSASSTAGTWAINKISSTSLYLEISSDDPLTLAEQHNNRIVRYTGSGPLIVNVAPPTYPALPVVPVGFGCVFIQGGTGQIRFQENSGAFLIDTADNAYNSRSQNSVVNINRYAGIRFTLSNDLTAVER